jgi:hypothetical protein
VRFPGRGEIYPEERAVYKLVTNSVLLYSSTELFSDDVPSLDANSYLPFKLVDSTVIQRIMNEFDAIGELEEERE